MVNIAILSAKRIDLATNAMLEYVKLKEYKKANEAYAQIISACTACHAITRGW